MNRDEISSMVYKSLDLPDDIRKVVTDYVMAGYLEGRDLQPWEQLRIVKQRMDMIWQKIKHCSERTLVHEKLTSMMASFPKPKVI